MKMKGSKGRKNSGRRFLAMLMAVVTMLASVTGTPLTVMADELIPEINACEDELLIVDEPLYGPDEEALKDETDKEELPYGLTGMSEGYVLSDEDITEKKEAASKGLASSLDNMVAGEDYADGEIMYMADSLEYAQQVAKAYNAELRSYSFGIAVAHITDPSLSVQEAVTAGLDPELDLPVVSPNHMIRLEEPETLDGSAEAEINEEIQANGTGDCVITGAVSWDDTVKYNNDPALKPGYEFAEKNAWHPDDERYDTKKQGYQWMHDMVGTYEAWWTTQGSSDITVAVIDTGVYTEHEDLQNDKRRVEEVPKDDYYISPTREGWTVTDGPVDDCGHGTHVAGIVAASANNDKGGAGIAPDVNILSLPIFTEFKKEEGGKTVEQENYCLDSNIAAAVKYAAGFNKNNTHSGKRRADIINMSLGGPGYNTAVAEAINKAYEQGVTVIASMGNTYSNTMSYPAAYDHVISVSAVDRAGNRTSFSSFGEWADIAAPGFEIFSTWNGHDENYDFSEKDSGCVLVDRDWYASWPGTSMAAPVVAGACALYMSAVGHVKPDEMEAKLKSTASKINDKTIGVGIVNVAAMLPNSAKDKELAAPVIETAPEKGGKYELLKDGTELAETSFVRISAPAGGTAYSISYTVNGKNPSFKDMDAAPGCLFASSGDEIPVSKLIENGATADKPFTLKAVYMSPQETVGKVCTVKNISVKTEEIQLTVSGPEYAAIGKSVTYTAKTVPADKLKKGVTWEIAEPVDGVSINKSGRVTVKKNAQKDIKFRIKATLTADTDVFVEREVTVKEPLTGVSIGFKEGKEPTSAVYDIKKNNKGELISARLYTVDIPGTDIDESGLDQLSVNTFGGNYGGDDSPVMDVASSRPGVAYADYDDKTGAWYVKAGRIAGTARLTWSTTDGSGKKASLTVKTIVPVSSVSVSTKNDQRFVPPGKSVQFIGTQGKTYGAPTVTKLNWDYRVEVRYEKGSEPVDITNDWKDKKLAKISQSGKLTIDKKAADYKPDGKDYYEINISGIAAATDDSEEKGEFTVGLSDAPDNIIWLFEVNDVLDNWNTKSGTYDVEVDIDTKDGAIYTYPTYVFIRLDDCGYNMIKELIMASSAKPGIVSLAEPSTENVEIERGGKIEKINCLKYKIVYGLGDQFKIGKTQTVPLTFTANDGSGRKVTIKLRIKAKERKD